MPDSSPRFAEDKDALLADCRKARVPSNPIKANPKQQTKPREQNDSAEEGIEMDYLDQHSSNIASCVCATDERRSNASAQNVMDKQKH
jgi:hypothetical protein